MQPGDLLTRTPAALEPSAPALRAHPGPGDLVPAWGPGGPVPEPRLLPSPLARARPKRRVTSLRLLVSEEPDGMAPAGEGGGESPGQGAERRARPAAHR